MGKEHVQVKGQPKQLITGMKHTGETIEVTGLFNGGAAGGCHTKQLAESVELTHLDPHRGAMTIANGKVDKLFKRKRIKLIYMKRNW